MDHLISTILDVLGTGTETTSSSLKCGVLLLLKHPEVTGKITDDGRDKVPGSHCQATLTTIPLFACLDHAHEKFPSLIHLPIIE